MTLVLQAPSAHIGEVGDWEGMKEKKKGLFNTTLWITKFLHNAVLTNKITLIHKINP